MLRTFAEHDVRFSESLDGFWEFATAEDRRGRTSGRESYPRRIAVPSAWETMPGLGSYRGTGWLRTDVSAVDGMALRLVFGGVSHTGTVFVDGRKVGRHYDAYTPWDVLAPGLKEGRHELVVEVDNTFGAHSALHLPNDYHTYGGITRPVEMQFVPALYIHRMHARPAMARRGDRWDLEVRVWLRNWSGARVTRRLVVSVAGAVHDFGRVTVQGRATREVRRTLRGVEAESWSAEAPALYFLEACLFDGDRPEDDLCDRIGFRQVGVRGRQVLLNGKPLRLRGYNRHEDHGCFGLRPARGGHGAGSPDSARLGLQLRAHESLPERPAVPRPLRRGGVLCVGGIARPAGEVRSSGFPRADRGVHARDGGVALQPAQHRHVGVPERVRHDHAGWPRGTQARAGFAAPDGLGPPRHVRRPPPQARYLSGDGRYRVAVMGAAIWQYCDVRITNEGNQWMTRPRTMNNKGTVDEFRRPKLAYETVKRRMLEAKRRWA